MLQWSCVKTLRMILERPLRPRKTSQRVVLPVILIIMMYNLAARLQEVLDTLKDVKKELEEKKREPL